ncbi:MULTISPECIES: hypothetical protein [Acinetobacter]|uniref:hypothetical protein n=1 Tax=Acinetobacter TaxID=469 RepID=UPI000D00F76F|nr:hypothetical protein [Acinetobacter sp. MYb10]QLD61425.1 hypothetical protein CQZ96_009150 [Acinetobacter sp. MYb10]
MERPILFNTPMVQAILEGRKTQTRRIVKTRIVIEQAEFELGNRPAVLHSEPSLQHYIDNDCPYGQVGDFLWVRETFCYGCIDEWDAEHPDDRRLFVDQYDGRKQDPIPKQWCLENNVEIDDVIWKPSIHMPRSASRILLEITNIRVEHLSDISRADSVSEGIKTFMVDCSRDGLKTAFKDYSSDNNAISRNNPVDSFRTLWESINGADSWAVNPWVWVVEFKVKEPQQ